MLKIAIANYPGANAALETRDTLVSMGHEVRIADYKEESIKNTDLVILPGGYSFGDYLRPGALAKGTPLTGAIKRFAKDGGNVLGIGNGFQILCEAELLPGILFRNPDHGFFKSTVYVKIENETFITKNLEQGTVLELPVACYYGSFYADKRTVNDLEYLQRIVLRYCDEFGECADETRDNGSNPFCSLKAIAGVASRHGNVVGMMPRIDRAVDEMFGNVNGLKFFGNL